MERREFLKALVLAPGLLPGVPILQSALLGSGHSQALGFSSPFPAQGSSELITSNPDFFVRNHFHTPQISSEAWSLNVNGLVGAPLKLSYSDLLLAPSVKRVLTMECAGNVSGGAGVGNAEWSGISLAELLKQAGASTKANNVILYGADSGGGEDLPTDTHFARAISLEKAMDGTCLLAYEMNGAPLPADHGFPLRALVGGWYGMDSVKWLTRIEVTDQPFQGYFQQKYYVAIGANGDRRPLTRMLVNSKFLRPSEGEEIRSKTYRIEGVAWAGEGKVTKVELRTAASEPWRPVTMTSSSSMIWTRWSYDWTVPRADKYTLEVRASDDGGHVQPDLRDPSRQDSYEFNTPHRISVMARV